MLKPLIITFVSVGVLSAAYSAFGMGKVPVVTGGSQSGPNFYDYGNGLINISKVSNISHQISISAFSQAPKCQLSASGGLNENTFKKVRDVARQAQAAGCGPAANISGSIKFDNFTLTLSSYEGTSNIEAAIKDYTGDLNSVKRLQPDLYDFGNGLINLSQVQYVTTQMSISAFSQTPKCQFSASGGLNENTFKKVRDVARQAQAAGCGPAANISGSIKFDNFTLTLSAYEGASNIEDAISDYNSSVSKIK